MFLKAKTIEKWRGQQFLEFLVFSWTSNFDQFLIDFGTQNGAQNGQKSIQKAFKKLIDFLIDFWSIFGPFLVPCWGPKSTQNGTKNDANIVTKNKVKKSHAELCRVMQAYLSRGWWCPLKIPPGPGAQAPDSTPWPLHYVLKARWRICTRFWSFFFICICILYVLDSDVFLRAGCNCFICMILNILKTVCFRF